MPQEATGQYLLMAYPDSIVRQVGGSVFTEAPSGGGFLDLILSYEKERYVYLLSSCFISSKNLQESE